MHDERDTSKRYIYIDKPRRYGKIPNMLLSVNLLYDRSSTDCDPLVSSIVTLQVYVPSSPSIR